MRRCVRGRGARAGPADCDCPGCLLRPGICVPRQTTVTVAKAERKTQMDMRQYCEGYACAAYAMVQSIPVHQAHHEHGESPTLSSRTCFRPQHVFLPFRAARHTFSGLVAVCRARRAAHRHAAGHAILAAVQSRGVSCVPRHRSVSVSLRLRTAPHRPTTSTGGQKHSTTTVHSINRIHISRQR